MYENTKQQIQTFPRCFSIDSSSNRGGSSNGLSGSSSSGNLDPERRNKGTSKTARDTLLDSASNQKLKNAIDQIYRPGATTGDGGLADAVRHQLLTGELVGGKDHLIKAVERIKNLASL